jgi:hypothetical protein
MEPDKLISFIYSILIFEGKTFDKLFLIFEETLVQLGNAGFQVNADKSEFFSKAHKFLDFVLTPEGYQPTPKRIKAI